MRIDITHIGEDYAKIEIKRYVQKRVVEYEVPLSVAVEVRNIMRALERIVTSSASSSVDINR